MKRFLLFAGNHYYPTGGIDDFIMDYDTLGEAKFAESNLDPYGADWSHILDTQTGLVYNPGGERPLPLEPDPDAFNRADEPPSSGPEGNDAFRGFVELVHLVPVYDSAGDLSDCLSPHPSIRADQLERAINPPVALIPGGNGPSVSGDGEGEGG